MWRTFNLLCCMYMLVKYNQFGMTSLWSWRSRPIWCIESALSLAYIQLFRSVVICQCLHGNLSCHQQLVSTCFINILNHDIWQNANNLILNITEGGSFSSQYRRVVICRYKCDIKRGWKALWRVTEEEQWTRYGCDEEAIEEIWLP